MLRTQCRNQHVTGAVSLRDHHPRGRKAPMNGHVRPPTRARCGQAARRDLWGRCWATGTSTRHPIVRLFMLVLPVVSVGSFRSHTAKTRSVAVRWWRRWRRRIAVSVGTPRWWSGRGHHSGDSAHRAANQRADRGSMAAGGRTTDRSAGSGPDQAATDCSLGGIVGIACAQRKAGADCQRAGRDQTFHLTVIPHLSVAL